MLSYSRVIDLDEVVFFEVVFKLGLVRLFVTASMSNRKRNTVFKSQQRAPLDLDVLQQANCMQCIMIRGATRQECPWAAFPAAPTCACHLPYVCH